MKRSGSIILRLLGVLLLLAVVLKGLQLINVQSMSAFDKPANITNSYEILEPEKWIGKELPILQYIDISERLKTGSWLILFYHYDCPDCRKAIPEYQQMAEDLAGNEEFLKVAFIEMPPYEKDETLKKSISNYGRLSDVKEWFVTTPAVTLVKDGKVAKAWEEKAPDFEAVMQFLANWGKGSQDSFVMR